MSFLIEANMSEISDGSAYIRYKEYLEGIRDFLPLHVYEFAIADWHYDLRDPRSPHDAWVQKLQIIESGSGVRMQERSNMIEVELLGAFHDRILKLLYHDVSTYSLNGMKKSLQHGDWLVDEVNVTNDGLLIHKVKSSNGAIWEIECVNFWYSQELRQP